MLSLRHATVHFVVACGVSFVFFFFSSSYAKRPQISEDAIRAICGGISSAVSISCFYPFETARTRLQVDPNLKPRSSVPLILSIVSREGLNGIYRGWPSLVLALFSTNLVYFYLFYWSRRLLASLGSEYLFFFGTRLFQATASTTTDLVGGYFAGVAAAVITGPLWMVNTRLKLQGFNVTGAQQNDKSSKSSQIDCNAKYNGIWDCAAKIAKEEGLLALWDGTVTSIILALNPAVQFGVYEGLKRNQFLGTMVDMIQTSIGDNHLLSSWIKNFSASAIEPLIHAIIAKFIATVVTYPIQILQTQRRAGLKRKEASGKPLNVCEMNNSCLKDLQQILNQVGISGLFRGLESKLTQSCLNAALMFFFYENMLSILVSLIG